MSKDKSAVQVEYKEPQPGGAKGTKLPSIMGLAKTVLVEPAGTPRSMYEQFRIFQGKLYWYDTIDHTWHNNGSGSVAGDDTQVQFNDAGSPGASPAFAFDKATGEFRIGDADDGDPSFLINFPDGNTTRIRVSEGIFNTLEILGRRTQLTSLDGNTYLIVENGAIGAVSTADLATAVRNVLLGAAQKVDITSSPLEMSQQGKWRKQQFQVTTTNATPATIANSFRPNTNTCLLFRATITAEQTSGFNIGHSAAYQRSGLYKYSGSTLTLIGSVHDEFTEEDTAGWDATLSIVSNTVTVTVTGAASTNITWNVNIEYFSPDPNITVF